MKSLLKACALISCMILPNASTADDFKWIDTEARFKETVVGKKLWLDKNHLTAKANGALTGNFGGNKLKGAWTWRGKYWCRTLTTHSKNTDCQKWETDGSVFRVTREKGKGKGFTYNLKK